MNGTVTDPVHVTRGFQLGLMRKTGKRTPAITHSVLRIWSMAEFQTKSLPSFPFVTSLPSFPPLLASGPLCFSHSVISTSVVVVPLSQCGGLISTTTLGDAVFL